MRALDASYVAGFLDGDGSIHFQLVRQKEYRFGYYIRSSVSFSQCTIARDGLEYLQRLIGGGYLLLPQLDELRDPEEFLRLEREVDAFATLNYSKTKRISAVDVEQHLRSKGVLCPCNDFLARHSEGMASLHTITDAMTRRPLEIG
jgi:hypothetical protein